MMRWNHARLVVPFLAFAACRCSPKPGHAGPIEATSSQKTAVSTLNDTSPSLEAGPMNRDVACPAELADTRRDGTKAQLYVEPTDEERKVLGESIARIARNEAAPALASIGFESVRPSTWSDVVLVREKGRRRGGGAYVVRQGSTSGLLVEAPHTFFDEGTFPLACELFQRSHARALFINTSHRYKSAPKTADGRHPADVAHSPTSLFHAATEALVTQQKGLSLVQVHGFATREVDARAVASSGEKRGGASHVAKVAKSLSEITAGKVLRYPEDTKELGAVTNVQGMVVRQGGGKFLHIEMDDEMRRRLLGDATLRARALDAIALAMGDE
jgi:hypothetical protein